MIEYDIFFIQIYFWEYNFEIVVHLSFYLKMKFTLSAGAVKYSNCFSAER